MNSLICQLTWQCCYPPNAENMTVRRQMGEQTRVLVPKEPQETGRRTSSEMAKRINIKRDTMAGNMLMFSALGG